MVSFEEGGMAGQPPEAVAGLGREGEGADEVVEMHQPLEREGMERQQPKERQREGEGEGRRQPKEREGKGEGVARWKPQEREGETAAMTKAAVPRPRLCQ